MLVPKGTPVFSSTNSNEIIAFFKEEMHSSGIIKFVNQESLLGIPTIEASNSHNEINSIRELVVYFERNSNIWYAGPNVVQKDFDTSEIFIRNYMQGPQSTYEALSILMMDNDFDKFIEHQISSSSMKETLSYYLDMLEYKRRRN